MKCESNKQIQFLIRTFLIIITILTLNQSLRAYQADVEDISNRDYYTKVIEVINNAQKSIHVSMFVVSLRPDQKESVVYQLCNALIDAKKRGVSVRVILDQNVNYYDDQKGIEGKNDEAYKYLSKNGIDVFYDNKNKYTHSKALVIDEKIVIIGSTNWSYSAIEKNNESSVLIRSPELAKSIIARLSNVETEKIVSEILFNKETALKINKVFFEDKELAGRMITKQDERACDLYLLLLYLNNGDREISFDYDL
jgi:phosphatidylserine/phosphatidylglycerophosphate/cardiolipin synthase-like enzyme